MREVEAKHKPITEGEHTIHVYVNFIVQAYREGGAKEVEKELRNFKGRIINNYKQTLINKGLLTKEVTSNE